MLDGERERWNEKYHREMDRWKEWTRSACVGVCVWLWMQHYVFGIYKNYRFALELFVVVVVDTYTLVGNMHIYTDCYKSSISCQLSVCSRSPYAGTSPLYAFERCELCLIWISQMHDTGSLARAAFFFFSFSRQNFNYEYSSHYIKCHTLYMCSFTSIRTICLMSAWCRTHNHRWMVFGLQRAAKLIWRVYVAVLFSFTFAAYHLVCWQFLVVLLCVLQANIKLSLSFESWKNHWSKESYATIHWKDVIFLSLPLFISLKYIDSIFVKNCCTISDKRFTFTFCMHCFSLTCRIWKALLATNKPLCKTMHLYHYIRVLNWVCFQW